MHYVKRIKAGTMRPMDGGIEPRDCWRVVDTQRVVDVFRDGAWWVTPVRHCHNNDGGHPPKGIAAHYIQQPSKMDAMVLAGRMLAEASSINRAR